MIIQAGRRLLQNPLAPEPQSPETLGQYESENFYGKIYF